MEEKSEGVIIKDAIDYTIKRGTFAPSVFNINLSILITISPMLGEVLEATK